MYWFAKSVCLRRFIFWDDYRPVEYASSPKDKAPTVSTETFLSLFQGEFFEVQASQAFNDGNPDVKWNRGAVITAKANGLWEPNPAQGVSEEDVKHMQSRVLQFQCVAQLQRLDWVDPCPCCMARWIFEEANAADAASALGPPLLPLAVGGPPAAHEPGRQALQGVAELFARSALPAAFGAALEQDALALGAVAVGELTRADWEGLASWSSLLPLQRRRLLASLNK